MSTPPPDLLLVALGFAAAGLGALGGMGGAVLLVPTLVLLGLSPLEAAPLGLLTVAAGSLAAAPRQIAEGLTHHRLGVVIETAAGAGAIAGAIAATRVQGDTLVAVLVVTALVTGGAGLFGRGLRHTPHPLFAAEEAGEWPGTLSGAYRLPQGVVPYRARNVAQGIAAMGAAGVLAGLIGIGGGFIKTPVMRELMGIPVKVAAATATFAVGLTAAAALLVFVVQGRLHPAAGAAVVAGSLLGGQAGAALQQRLPPRALRIAVSLLLFAVAFALLAGVRR